MFTTKQGNIRHLDLNHSAKALEIDLVFPIYNETEEAIKEIVTNAFEALSPYASVKIYAVDDGSAEPFELPPLEAPVKLLRHSVNRGYGAALKTAIREGSSPWIAIIDSDSTYPPEKFSELVKYTQGHDMVTGVRTHKINHTPWLRRMPKWLLNRYASFLTGKKVVDVNSGMRLFRRELAYSLWSAFPNGFSFTSTLTIGCLLNNGAVKEISIPYYARTSTSSIRPIRDTIHFFRLLGRLGLLLAPMKIFFPISATFCLFGLAKGLAFDYAATGQMGELSALILLFGVHIFVLGLLAELIVRNRIHQVDRSKL